ncbi:hypothetical protein [Microbispora sp. CA-102843]|uniref:hypothetical protein n=1 Tax=Microbispora sp. CA-102843 TaxID=3239952 RepID=UPI003D937168
MTGPSGARVTVKALVQKPVQRPDLRVKGFVEAGGYVAIEAAHYTRAVSASGAGWKVVPGIGRTGDGVTPWPVTAESRDPGGDGARLEYTFTVTGGGPVKVSAYLSPRNNVLPTEGLRYAVSIDDGAPQEVNVTKVTGANDTTMNAQWARNTSDNANVTTTTHTISGPGVHTLKFWMADPTVVVQRFVVDTGGVIPSYLGPPESRNAR